MIRKVGGIRDQVDQWDLVLKDPDTMHVLQHNQQLALLSITQVIRACNTLLARHVILVIRINQVHIRISQDQVDRMVTIMDQGIMDLAHQIVDRARMVTITALQVDRIILQDQVGRMITMVLIVLHYLRQKK